MTVAQDGGEEMSGFDLTSLASPLLADGEEVVAGVRVNWNGMVPPVHADADAVAAFPSAKQMVLVLTGGRLLAWALGISGKPKQFLGDVPLSAISGGRVRPGAIRFAHPDHVEVRRQRRPRGPAW